MRRFKATMETSPGSEDCLVLNVWTPATSGKRPVMVWLHGGGFAIGSGGDPQYEGSALARRGDVVVVTLNHRLNALGYLYLGDLSPDFADSGNAGTLDIVLALQWVRDNIARFGGDPDNVTIFGQSGGGAKVSAMLAVPAAKGLFHKAIIQSGPGLRMADRSNAAEIAEKTLAALGIAKADVHKLQTVDVNSVVRASAQAADETGGNAMRKLAPVVDGRTLPTEPFDPVAPAIARDIPVMIGSTRDEATLFTSADPRFGKMTEEEAKARFDAVLKDRGPAALAAYKAHFPNDAPTYWFTSMLTDMGTWMDSIRLAERKQAQHGAPVYMYRVDWHIPVLDGVLRSPHGTEVPLVFDNVDKAPLIMGTGPEARRLAALMSQAWVDFARSGNPSQPALPWPAYDPQQRSTAIFETQSRIVSDPDGDLRRFWA
jgi:para-nitrobenzyl esterase